MRKENEIFINYRFKGGYLHSDMESQDQFWEGDENENIKGQTSYWKFFDELVKYSGK